MTASATLPAPLRRPARPKRVLMWHVHGSYCTSLVAGGHDYVVPVIPGRGADGRGRARTWTWPENVVELPPERLRDEDEHIRTLAPVECSATPDDKRVERNAELRPEA